MDFTLKTYKSLLITLKNNDYQFFSMEEFASLSLLSSKSPHHQLTSSPTPSHPVSLAKADHPLVIMRHDIDRLPQNALKIAKIESGLGIKSSYYFRNKKSVFNEKTIKEIIDMSHEFGYHYENLDNCNGDVDKAYEDFCQNLEQYRKFYPVKTICMHGSPLSKCDNRDVWKKYSYKELGIIAEPYFDVDYDEVFYISDTGGKWNNQTSSIRDKVNSGFDIEIKNTQYLIEKVKKDELPNKIMINVHPQRWTNNPILWTKELVWQNTKNFIKKHFFIRK